MLFKCAATTPDIECWCVSMPIMPDIDEQNGCYCGQCYIKILEEQKNTSLDTT
jgi:hypothetical protein